MAPIANTTRADARGSAHPTGIDVSPLDPRRTQVVGPGSHLQEPRLWRGQVDQPPLTATVTLADSAVAVGGLGQITHSPTSARWANGPRIGLSALNIRELAQAGRNFPDIHCPSADLCNQTGAGNTHCSPAWLSPGRESSRGRQDGDTTGSAARDGPTPKSSGLPLEGLAPRGVTDPDVKSGSEPSPQKIANKDAPVALGDEASPARMNLDNPLDKCAQATAGESRKRNVSLSMHHLFYSEWGHSYVAPSGRAERASLGEADPRQLFGSDGSRDRRCPDSRVGARRLGLDGAPGQLGPAADLAGAAGLARRSVPAGTARPASRFMSPALLGFATCLGFAFLGGPALADPCNAIPDRGPLPSYLAKGNVFSGPVVYIGDGDGLCLDVGGQGASDRANWVEVRIADFFAPELDEPGGPTAKTMLERLAIRRQAVCTSEGRKTWDRVVAVCRIGGVSIGDRMRQVGVAEGGRRR